MYKRQAFAGVEHARLDERIVDGAAHFAAERVNFAHQMSLTRAADGGVAGHEGDGIQSRMLHTGKGPAVHSLRAQADKRAYQQRMKRALFAEPRLTVRQGEGGRFLTENGAISGLETTTDVYKRQEKSSGQA